MQTTIRICIFITGYWATVDNIVSYAIWYILTTELIQIEKLN